ncbi:unnamed protein product [Lactuca virosa]|uniref:Uncharacterized protein n=1 Tax=Lactuca virosa TaxID=75947 RepID=A0AAU9MEX6_9ASTR|nr:unnamed protein product [Lactuca virosa]
MAISRVGVTGVGVLGEISDIKSVNGVISHVNKAFFWLGKNLEAFDPNAKENPNILILATPFVLRRLLTYCSSLLALSLFRHFVLDPDIKHT